MEYKKLKDYQSEDLQSSIIKEVSKKDINKSGEVEGKTLPTE